jgi:hypothetical protein
MLHIASESKKKKNMTWKLNHYEKGTHPDLGKDSQQRGKHGEEEAIVKIQIKPFKKSLLSFNLENRLSGKEVKNVGEVDVYIGCV